MVESESSPQYASVAQLVEQWTENPRVVGSIPTGGTMLLTMPESKKFDSDGQYQDAGVAHPVERHLAKVEVASSSLVIRSKKGEGKALNSCEEFKCFFIRRHSQVVRHESAKL